MAQLSKLSAFDLLYYRICNNSMSAEQSEQWENLSQSGTQFRNLNQMIDRLGERVDRLQTMLGVAVPLLQRIAPKS
jgi:hypothetical protein